MMAADEALDALDFDASEEATECRLCQRPAAWSFRCTTDGCLADLLCQSCITNIASRLRGHEAQCAECEVSGSLSSIRIVEPL